MQCKATKRNGNRCGANALIGKDRCALHGTRGLAAVLGSRGGRRRTVLPLRELKCFAAPATARDMLEIVAATVAEVRRGSVDTRRANCVAQLAGVFVRITETVQLEMRVAALEASQLGRVAGGKY